MQELDVEKIAKELLTGFDGMQITHIQEILRRALELSGQSSVFKVSLLERP